MDPCVKIVTSLPLDELWDGRGRLRCTRVRVLQPAELPALLRAGPVRFAVASVGTQLRWVASEETFSFWEREARQRIADPEARIVLEDYPDEIAYVASLWEAEGESAAIVLLEAHH
jgi:hypothetical protein